MSNNVSVTHQPWGKHDVAWSMAIAAVVTCIVGMTGTDLGFTRDEGYYFKAAEQYCGYFHAIIESAKIGTFNTAFDSKTIDLYWTYNHEHPAGIKTLFAWAVGLREAAFPQVPKHQAIRAVAWLVAGASAAATYVLARCYTDRRLAIFAAAAFACMPHVFWHMHVACFDIAATLGHTLIAIACARPITSRRRFVAVGVAFAVALSFKHNVLIFPFVLLGQVLVLSARFGPAIAPVRHAFKCMLAMTLIAPPLYYLHWPWLWHHPIQRFANYLGYHLHHEHYPILYFRELLVAPPFPIHFPFVMSAVTIPVVTLTLMLIGVVLALQALWRTTADGKLAPGDATSLLINAALPFVLIALPWTPIFGGTKHWMNALPFLCVLAAVALGSVFDAIAMRWPVRPQRITTIVMLLCLAPGVMISARVWPYGLGSYNELIGFARGAARVGMQRTFWGYESREVLPTINLHAAPSARIHFGDTNKDSMHMYQADELLRGDLRYAGSVAGADVACVQPQGEFKNQWLDVQNRWRPWPDEVVHAEGVPLLTLTWRAP